MNRSLQVFVAVLVPLLLSVSGFSKEPLKPLRIDTPPIIDGRIDDGVWQTAPSVGNFKTYAPDFGKDPTGQTEVKMVYDKENLYFAFRCYDADVTKIKTSVADRDKIIPDDWVCINLDSFNDQQALTAFYINPMGIQADSRFAANNEDFSSDYVWYSAGHSDATGYTVEVQLPLKSLRYSGSDSVTMGVVFERYVSRNTEHSTSPALDPARGAAFLTEMRPMVFYNLSTYKLVEVLPALTYSYISKDREGRLVKDESKPDLSLTMKYGLTSKLIFDGTINPDFSQVESDAGQVDVNLRTDLFYSEKRPFFLEGNENFRIAASSASELDPIISIVHTRTIVNPLAGVKLTGKIAPQTTVAAIGAMDELPDELNQGKYAMFPIMRLKQALSEDSYIGGIYAGRVSKSSYNLVVGADEMYRFPNASVIESHVLFSPTKLYEASKPKVGHALGLSYWKSTRDLDYGITGKKISEDFLADMGYITRTGIIQATALARPKFYFDSDIFQRLQPELFTSVTNDEPSGLWETFNHVSLQQFFLGSLTVKVKYSNSTEIFNGQRFKTGGYHAALGGQLTKEIYLSTLYRHTDWIYYRSSLQGKRNYGSVAATLQPADEIAADLSFLYSDLRREDNNELLYAYRIFRGKLAFQLNQYFSLRGIIEYNHYKKTILTDFLASYTYIPGTVIYLGYGSFYEKMRWEDGSYIDDDTFLEMKRGIFFKMSYLWRS